MTENQTKEKLSKIEQIEQECLHEGKYKTAGAVSLPAGGGQVTLLTILFCANCGTAMMRKFELKGMSVASVVPNMRNMRG